MQTETGFKLPHPQSNIQRLWSYTSHKKKNVKKKRKEAYFCSTENKLAPDMNT